MIRLLAKLLPTLPLPISFLHRKSGFLYSATLGWASCHLVQWMLATTTQTGIEMFLPSWPYSLCLFPLHEKNSMGAAGPSSLVLTSETQDSP